VRVQWQTREAIKKQKQLKSVWTKRTCRFF